MEKKTRYKIAIFSDLKMLKIEKTLKKNRKYFNI